MKTTLPEAPSEKLLKEFESVVAEAEHLIQSISEATSDKAGSVRTSVEAGLAATRDRLGRIRTQVVDQASGAARATDDYVQENPWQVIGVAAAAGVLAGLAAGHFIARR
jgi:ElaB/YqjD/DUF883 family membrane-anchored ribosome-binding protein